MRRRGGGKWGTFVVPLGRFQNPKESLWEKVNSATRD